MGHNRQMQSVHVTGPALADTEHLVRKPAPQHGQERHA